MRLFLERWRRCDYRVVSERIIACICEGTAESVIVNRLLDENKLVFSREDLLDNEVLRSRSARKFEERYLRKSFNKKITVYRVLDSRREDFKLRKVYEPKVDVINVITAPEIEMLIIINEGKYKDFCKYKQDTLPSVYCKKILKMRDVKSTEFITDYFADINKLLRAIKEYKRLSKIPKGEICLTDLIKD